MDTSIRWHSKMIILLLYPQWSEHVNKKGVHAAIIVQSS